MPTTFTPIDNAVLAGVRDGDERALERLFRDHYEALLEKAKGELDDPASAPRVVEGAILRTWDQRTTFETPKGLESFLHQAVHDAAVREKSRRASLHRFETHEGVHRDRRPNDVHLPTVDEAWAHLHTTLHPPPVDASRRARAKAESRHAAAEHMAQVARKRSPWLTLVYALAAGGVVAALLFAIFRDTPEKRTTRLLASDNAREITSRFGQVGNLTLDDGSVATIGADSRVRIVPNFGTDARAVRVTGTASFDVPPGASPIPFEVRLGDAAVVVTGTKFQVNYDTLTHLALVRVVDGSVDVRHGEARQNVAAGSALAVEGNGTMRAPTTQELDEALAWNDGRLVIVERPLRDALEQIRRWYAIALIPADMALMDRTVSVDARIESSPEMIADLEESGKLHFGWEDKTMVLYDASAAPKAAQRGAGKKR